MKVESTNVSQARQIQYQSKTYNTGIFKHSIAGPLEVSADGISSDTTCDLINHGGDHKAVYGFSLAHYPHWRDSLNKPELAPGAFGENLSMSELDEETICIGDQLSIGSTVLEVSQPRVPCFKLGVALGDDRAPALFARHFHTGIYFRVVTPGLIAAGDDAEITYRHSTPLSVYALFRAMFDKTYQEARSLLERAASIEELAPEWQEKVHRRLTQT